MRVMCLVVALALFLCSGCGMPSERANYRVACQAVREQPGVPDNVRMPGLRDVELHIQKNAAQILVPVEFDDAGGATVRASYTVWTKRVARTWTLEKCFPTPRH